MSRYSYNSSTQESTLIAGASKSTNFIGTQAEWNALTSAEKAKFDKSTGATVNIIDDDIPDDIIGTEDISGIADGTLTGVAVKHEEDIASLNSALANKEDKMTTGSGYFQIGDMLVCYGQITVGGSSSTSGAMKRITFPKAFSGVPMVVTTPVTNAALTLDVHVQNVSNTQAEFYSVGNDNVWYTAGVITDYIAIGSV